MLLDSNPQKLKDVQRIGSVIFRTEPLATFSDSLENLTTRLRDVIQFIWTPRSGKWTHFTTFTGVLHLDAGGGPARPTGYSASRQNGRSAPNYSYNGYDPHGMLCTTIQTSDSRLELPQTFKSTALAAAVARREQASDAAMAPADAAARTCSTTLPPPATRSAGPQQGKKKPTWQPLHLPKPRQPAIAHIGANAIRLVTVVILRDQYLILAYTPNPLIADELIGELTFPSSVGPVPLFGYLCADTQDSCYGVVTVHSTNSEAELQQRLYWPRGRDPPHQVIRHLQQREAHLFRQGEGQPYKKTVPACSQCGSVGHHLATCPSPKPDLCGPYGNTVPLMDGARAPYECTPKCAIFARPHFTGDRSCKERYRAPPPKSPTPPLESQPGSAKRKRRRPWKPRSPATRASRLGTPSPATKSPPPPHPGAGAPEPCKRAPTPPGPPTERSPSRQGPPASPTSHPLPPGLQPAAQGELTWAAHIRQGHQVVEAFVNHPPPLPTSTTSGPAPEAIDSAPSEQRDFAGTPHSD
ncbi:hypothetical protein HPB49_019805 [Dermacentor silvarum]|uniref:Uncharacterized protein n=1 Tax=Dermacentor silvarum TaxID=543639 RepID=A0ACB8C582_DERSI|nr:hypothetical protein HPB49_019805 [Dermacentor silvarum]